MEDKSYLLEAWNKRLRIVENMVQRLCGEDKLNDDLKSYIAKVLTDTVNIFNSLMDNASSEERGKIHNKKKTTLDSLTILLPLFLFGENLDLIQAFKDLELEYRTNSDFYKFVANNNPEIVKHLFENKVKSDVPSNVIVESEIIEEINKIPHLTILQKEKELIAKQLSNSGYLIDNKDNNNEE